MKLIFSDWAYERSSGLPENRLIFEVNSPHPSSRPRSSVSRPSRPSHPSSRPMQTRRPSAPNRVRYPGAPRRPSVPSYTPCPMPGPRPMPRPRPFPRPHPQPRPHPIPRPHPQPRPGPHPMPVPGYRGGGSRMPRGGRPYLPSVPRGPGYYGPPPCPGRAPYMPPPMPYYSQPYPVCPMPAPYPAYPMPYESLPPVFCPPQPSYHYEHHYNYHNWYQYSWQNSQNFLSLCDNNLFDTLCFNQSETPCNLFTLIPQQTVTVAYKQPDVWQEFIVLVNSAVGGMSNNKIADTEKSVAKIPGEMLNSDEFKNKVQQVIRTAGPEYGDSYRQIKKQIDENGEIDLEKIKVTPEMRKKLTETLKQNELIE